MANLVGRTFIHHGIDKVPNQTATVVAQDDLNGPRPTVMVTVRLTDGTEHKMDARNLPIDLVFIPVGASK